MKPLITFLTLLLMLGGVVSAEDRLYLNCKFAGGEMFMNGKFTGLSSGDLPDQTIELDIKNKKIISAISYEPNDPNFFESWSDSEISWGIQKMYIDKKTKKLVPNKFHREFRLNRYTGDFIIDPIGLETLNYKCAIKKKIF
jgi:hypothetical protein